MVVCGVRWVVGGWLSNFMEVGCRPEKKVTLQQGTHLAIRPSCRKCGAAGVCSHAEHPGLVACMHGGSACTHDGTGVASSAVFSVDRPYAGWVLVHAPSSYSTPPTSPSSPPHPQKKEHIVREEAESSYTPEKDSTMAALDISYMLTCMSSHAVSRALESALAWGQGAEYEGLGCCRSQLLVLLHGSALPQPMHLVSAPHGQTAVSAPGATHARMHACTHKTQVPGPWVQGIKGRWHHSCSTRSAPSMLTNAHMQHRMHEAQTHLV